MYHVTVFPRRIPNVLSGDNTFVSESKQTPLRQTKIDDWIHNAERLREVMPEEQYRNYQRNKTLILILILCFYRFKVNKLRSITYSRLVGFYLAF